MECIEQSFPPGDAILDGFGSCSSLAIPMASTVTGCDKTFATPPNSCHRVLDFHHLYVSLNSRKRRIVDLVAAAAGVASMYAPPAKVYISRSQSSMLICLIVLCRRVGPYLLARSALPDARRVT